MFPGAIIALVLVGLVVVVLAGYLLWVIAILRSVNRSLRRISGAVATVAERCRPITPLVEAVNQDVAAVAGAAEQLASELGGAAVERVS